VNIASTDRGQGDLDQNFSLLDIRGSRNPNLASDKRGSDLLEHHLLGGHFRLPAQYAAGLSRDEVGFADDTRACKCRRGRPKAWSKRDGRFEAMKDGRACGRTE
jgi:hypothetical protein